MSRKKLSRRQFVAATAMSSAALITAPYIRGAHAAGKLNIGFWDHWVPGANKASTELVNEWAAKEKVEVTIDYIPSQGNKNLLTIAAEAQAKSGHDILAMPTWWPHAQADLLEPMNDVVEAAHQAERRSQRHRPISRQGRQQMARRSRLRRQPDQGTLLAHRSDEEARRHRRPGDVSRRRSAESRCLDHGCLPEGGRGLPQGRRSLRHRSRRDQRLRRYRRRVLPRLRRRGRRCQGQRRREERQRAAGSRILQEADGVPAVGRAGLGRRFQQQVAGLGQGRADHEPAERMGGGQARRAADRRAMLDPRLPGRSEGPLCAVPARISGASGISPRTRRRPRAC